MPRKVCLMVGNRAEGAMRVMEPMSRCVNRACRSVMHREHQDLRSDDVWFVKVGQTLHTPMNQSKLISPGFCWWRRVRNRSVLVMARAAVGAVMSSSSWRRVSDGIPVSCRAS